MATHLASGRASAKYRAATSSCKATPCPQSPSVNVTRIIRRGLEAVYPASYKPTLSRTSTPAVSLIRAVIHQEFANLGLISTVCAMTTPDAALVSADRPRQRPCAFHRSRNASERKTADDEPICFRSSQLLSQPSSPFPLILVHPHRTEYSAPNVPEEGTR